MDLLSRDGFLSKAKRIFSSVSRIILWTSRLRSPSQVPKECLLNQYCLQPGLQTLVSSQEEPPQNQCHPSFIINPYTISSASYSQSSPSSSLNSDPSWRRTSTDSSSCSPSAMDDLIGAESGVYMNSEQEEEETPIIDTTSKAPYKNRNLNKQNKLCTGRTREFPPPISLLARTGNLPGHMPWVLTRHYNNGNLVLKEEKVKHHEYFEAYRDNGRLILNLILLDDTITCGHTMSEKNNEKLELQELEFSKEVQEKDSYSGEDKLEDYEYQSEAEAEAEADPDQDDFFDTAENTTLVDKSRETMHKGPIMMQIPKTYLENEVESCGALRKCLTYTEREISDKNFFCNVSAHFQPGGDTYFVHSGSAPLAVSVRPMATVM